LHFLGEYLFPIPKAREKTILTDISHMDARDHHRLVLMNMVAPSSPHFHFSSEPRGQRVTFRSSAVCATCPRLRAGFNVLSANKLENAESFGFSL